MSEPGEPQPDPPWRRATKHRQDALGIMRRLGEFNSRDSAMLYLLLAIEARLEQISAQLSVANRKR